MANKTKKPDYDIFISHSSKDTECAKQCCEYLEKREFELISLCQSIANCLESMNLEMKDLDKKVKQLEKLQK